MACLLNSVLLVSCIPVYYQNLPSLCSVYNNLRSRVTACPLTPQPIHFQKLHSKGFPKHTWSSPDEPPITYTSRVQIDKIELRSATLDHSGPRVTHAASGRIKRPARPARGSTRSASIPGVGVQRVVSVAQGFGIDLQHDRRALNGSRVTPIYAVCRGTCSVALFGAATSERRHVSGGTRRPKHGLDGTGAAGRQEARALKH